MTTIEIMDAEEVRTELDALRETASSMVTKSQEETATEIRYVWNAIQELRTAVQTLCERAKIEPPEWNLEITYD